MEPHVQKLRPDIFEIRYTFEFSITGQEFTFNMSLATSRTFQVMLEVHKQRLPGIKTKWTPDEDELLKEAVRMLGENSWFQVSNYVATRNGKQCRERWVGQICPEVSKLTWSLEEDRSLIRMQRQHGNKWTFISQFFESRSPICVKNRWYWLKRHRQTTNTSSSEQESPRNNIRTFEPLQYDDEKYFGDAFLMFRESLVSHGTLCIA